MSNISPIQSLKSLHKTLKKWKVQSEKSVKIVCEICNYSSQIL